MATDHCLGYLVTCTADTRKLPQNVSATFFLGFSVPFFSVPFFSVPFFPNFHCQQSELAVETLDLVA